MLSYILDWCRVKMKGKLMDLETWRCPGCGEDIEKKCDICWKCGVSKEATPEEIASTQKDELEKTPPEQMLSQILRLQMQQKETLSEIQSRVAFLYAAVSVVLMLMISLLFMAF